MKIIYLNNNSISMNIRIDLQNHQSFDQLRSNDIKLVYDIVSFLIYSNNIFWNIKRRLRNYTRITLKEMMTKQQHNLQIYDF